MPIDPAPSTVVRNYMYISKYPDHPEQIRVAFAKAMPEAFIGKVPQSGAVMRPVPGVAHRFQISCVPKPLSELLGKFTAACVAIAPTIGRPVQIDAIPEGAVAHFGPTGKRGDKIVIDIAFKFDRGLLEVIYLTPSIPA